MIYTIGTNQTIILSTSNSGSIDYNVSYTDITDVDVLGDSSQGNITTATTTTIVSAASASSTTRQIKSILVVNRATTSNTLTLRKNTSGTHHFLTGNIVLNSGEFFRLDNDGLIIYTSSGQIKSTITNSPSSFVTEVYKISSAPEGAGQFYCFSKDTGLPGSWSIGTPGVNGRNCIGTFESGSISFADPTDGEIYLSDASFASTVACQVSLLDCLWVNSGLTVTSTTAQTITQPTLPTRDLRGTSNGEMVNVGILVNTATTNAAAITNITMSYTNSSGVAGRTATMASFPQSAVAGTFIKFQLQTGDTGVRSIQSITFGTSLVGGAVSLVCYRQLFSQSCLVANVGGSRESLNKDIKLYNGSCIFPIILSTGTTAVTLNGSIYFTNK